jgi:hypothetical protein
MITLVMTICSVLVSTDCRYENIRVESYIAVGVVGEAIIAEVDAKKACETKAQAQMADPKRKLLRQYEYVKQWACKQPNQVATRL